MKRAEYLSWDEYFMASPCFPPSGARIPARRWGPGIVGADNKILSVGYNGMPAGCSDDVMPWEREGEPLKTKYLFVCHAELNAILNHAGPTLRGATLYSTLFPCNECAKAIIQAGIRKVVYLSDKYAETDAVTASKSMFQMAGVACLPYQMGGKSVELSL